jgi:hypothetical protein
MHERAHLETLLNALGVRSRRLQPVVAHEVCLFDRAARVFV